MAPVASKNKRRVDNLKDRQIRPVNSLCPLPGLTPTPPPIEDYLCFSPESATDSPEDGMSSSETTDSQLEHRSTAGSEPPTAQASQARSYPQMALSIHQYNAIPTLQFYSPGLTPDMSRLASPWATTPQTVSPYQGSPVSDPRLFPVQDGYFTRTPANSSYLPSEYISGTESEFEPPYNSTATSSPSKAESRSPQPPRPPNAWILYRSDMLKAIAAGKPPAGLGELMHESGASSSSPAADEASVTETTSSVKGKKKKISKPKKGSKEPSEAFVSTLGKGKTGRGIPQADISKMISQLWKRETPAIKGKYEAMSKQRKEEHDKMFPDYKFQPMRKADKIRLREEKEREREEQKRQKDLERSGGGVRRRARARGSPSSPYSPGGGSRSRVNGRALSYPSPSSSCGEQKFSSYPFPIPLNNLPSMRTEEHVHAAYGTPVPSNTANVFSVGVPENTPTPPTPQSSASATRSASPQKSRLPHRLSTGFTADNSDRLSPASPSSTLPQNVIRHVSSLGLSPSERDSVSSPAPDRPEHCPADTPSGQQHVEAILHEAQPGVFVPLQPGWVNVQNVGPAYAFPATFQPLPLPTELDPGYLGENGSLEDITNEQALQALSSQTPMPRFDYTLWVDLYPRPSRTSDSETTDDSVAMAHSLSARGSISGDSSSSYGFNALAVDSTQATGLWTTAGAPTYTSDESRGSYSGPSSGSEYGSFGESQPTTYDYYSQFLDPSASFLDIGRETNEPHQLLPAWSPGQPYTGLESREEGPMLNTAGPLSPGEDWAQQTTPRNAMSGTLQSQQSRLASTSASRVISGGSGPAARYVSQSAFPSHPLSVDAGALGMMGSNRIPSFVQFGETIADEADNLDWAVEEEMPTARPSGSSGGEMQKSQEANSPVKDAGGLKVLTTPERRSSIGALRASGEAGVEIRRQGARRFSESA